LRASTTGAVVESTSAVVASSADIVNDEVEEERGYLAFAPSAVAKRVETPLLPCAR